MSLGPEFDSEDEDTFAEADEYDDAAAGEMYDQEPWVGSMAALGSSKWADQTSDDSDCDPWHAASSGGAHLGTLCAAAGGHPSEDEEEDEEEEEEEAHLGTLGGGGQSSEEEEAEAEEEEEEEEEDEESEASEDDDDEAGEDDSD